MSDWFPQKRGQLQAENVQLADIAKEFGTPVYVYSRTALVTAFKEFQHAMPSGRGLVCFAVKANPSRAILATLAGCGAGFDIVSGGELARVLAAGGDPARVVFSGIGKTDAEMRYALAQNIRCFNVESAAELTRLNEVAISIGMRARISLRINPNVEASTHRYIATGGREHKFGIPADKCLELGLACKKMPGIELTGLASHIGSQIFREEPFGLAADFLVRTVSQFADAGIALKSLDFGGGLGVPDSRLTDSPPSRGAFVRTLLSRLPPGIRDHFALIIEPGRSIAADSGVLLTRVEYIKPGASKAFVIVDAAMNDLLRPALYDAWHDIVPVMHHADEPLARYDVVGPVCETGDFLGQDRELKVKAGDLLAVMQAGAYGASMSSTYNSRPRCAEVMVEGDTARLVRRRESIDDLMAGESKFDEADK